MKLPGYKVAVVPRNKVVRYLLSPAHPHGRHKWAFFAAFGFKAERWEELAAALKRHAANDVVRVEQSAFGTRYVVEGIIETPDGRNPSVRSIWFREPDDEVPRFVTAYRLKGV